MLRLYALTGWILDNPGGLEFSMMGSCIFFAEGIFNLMLLCWESKNVGLVLFVTVAVV